MEETYTLPYEDTPEFEVKTQAFISKKTNEGLSLRSLKVERTITLVFSK